MTTDTEARELLSQLTRFTPGPWRNADGTIQSKAKVTHPDGTVEWTYKYARNIAHVVEDSDYIVNGNIIAAAPDMHRLLTALLAENERLRKPITEIVNLLWSAMGRQEDVGPHGGYIYMKLRAALKGSDDDK